MAALCMLANASAVHAEDMTFTIRQLTPETALKLAKATLEACRADGFQVSVAVADRAGLVQVMLRDRFAGPHTIDVSANKAWTAVSFKQDTLSIAKATTSPENAGQRHFPRFVAVGGGILVESAGSLLGGLGVSGAPGGEADDRCARIGLKAIQGDLDF